MVATAMFALIISTLAYPTFLSLSFKCERPEGSDSPGEVTIGHFLAVHIMNLQNYF